MSFVIRSFLMLAIAHNAYGALSFGDTQDWDSSVLSFVGEYKPKLELLNEQYEDWVLPPATNSDAKTVGELSTLLNLKKYRTPEAVKNINRELQFCGFRYRSYQFGVHEEIDTQIASALLDVTYYIFKLKQKFDRVRPNYLVPEIAPVIENPGHAAYPSGHGGQSYIVGLILADLFPKTATENLQYARSIGKNREIAGVHYESDTMAGQEVARRYYELLRSTPVYQQFLSDYSGYQPSDAHLDESWHDTFGKCQVKLNKLKAM